MTDGNSSLPPNPPPVSAWTTRAASSSRPEAALERRVQVVRALERARDGDAAAVRRARRSSRCSRCTAAPGGRRGTRPRARSRRRRARPRRPSPASIVYCAKAWSDASGSKTRRQLRRPRLSPGGAPRAASPGRARRGARAARRGAGSRRRSGRGSAGRDLIELTMFSPGMSAAVTTTTFDQSKAGSRSSASKVACASVERIVAPYHAPGTTMSSVYRAVPVSLAGPSRRSGAAGRARPGTTVPGWTTTRVRGLGAGRHAAVWEPSMAHDDTTATAAGPPDRDRPSRTAPDPPRAVRGRTVNAGRERAIRWSHSGVRAPIIGCLIARTSGTHTGMLESWKSRRTSCCRSWSPRSSRTRCSSLLVVVAGSIDAHSVEPGRDPVGAAGQPHVDLIRRRSGHRRGRTSDGEPSDAGRAPRRGDAAEGAPIPDADDVDGRPRPHRRCRVRRGRRGVRPSTRPRPTASRRSSSSPTRKPSRRPRASTR